MKIKSSAFTDQQPIPVKYTGDGQNVSPPISWEDVPQGTKSLALIVDDPDAPGGTFTHWLVHNIPPDKKGLPEGIATSPELKGGILQGNTSYGRTGYRGPHPPPGRPHRYYFSLYALDQVLNLKAGTSKQQLEEAMQGHIMALTQLLGTYGR
jgi:Raf kinase inhibitor-like YbhB/YbcL family protein